MAVTRELLNTGTIVPEPQQRKGPLYASDIVSAFENYDEHDHTPGKGKLIQVAAMLIDANVDFHGWHLENLGAATFRSATNVIANGTLYSDGTNLFFKDGDGKSIRFTLNGSVDVSTSGGIGGISGSAGVSYFTGGLNYTFLDENGDKASIQMGNAVIVKKNASNAERNMTLDFDADTAAGSFTITFPGSSGTVVLNGTEALTFTHATQPSIPASGQSTMFFDSADNLPKWRNTAGTVTTFGAGGGAENAKTANFATGGDLDTITLTSFTNAGAGVFSVEIAAPIRGSESAHYAGYALSSTLTYNTDIPIPRGYRNSTVKISFKYTGGGNIKLDVVDRTGDTDVGIVNTSVLAIPQSVQDATVTPIYNDFLADVFIPDTVEKVRLRWVGTGDNPQTDAMVDIPFIFDDIVVTPVGETTLPVTTYTLAGGANTVTLSKFNSSNDSPATDAGIGTFTSSATLTEGTDYEDYGAEWIESITTASTVVNLFAAFDSTTQMTYTITSVDNAFDTSRLPTVAFSPTSVVDALPYGADHLDTLVRNPYRVVSASFSGNKLVIVIQGTSSKESGGSATTATSGSANFGLSVTKTVGFGPATLAPQTNATSVSYEQSINQIPENRFSARIDNAGDVGAATVISENVSFIKSATKTGTGLITVVFNDDMFSITPSIQCVAVPPDGTEDDINSDNTQITNVTATGFNIGYLHQGGGGGGEAHVFRNQGDIDISVTRQGSDYKEPTLLPTGAYILTPAFPIGSMVDSVLTEPQFNQNTQGSWVLCDGRDISSSALATLTSNNFAPNFSGRYAGMSGIAGGAQIQVDTFGNFSNGDTITIGNVILTASDSTNANNVFQFVTSNDATATNIAAAYNNTKEAQFTTATVSTNTVTIPSGISVLNTTSTSAVTFPGLSAKTLNSIQASEVKASDVALTDPGHTHPGTQGVNGGLSGSLNGYQSVTSRQAGGTYDTGSRTTGITISAGDETRPATYVVNKFIKIGD